MLRCPLCSVSLWPSSAEAHLRDELDAPELRCLLCRRTFFDQTDADEHFRGPLAKHPGAQPQLAQVRLEPEKKARLVELLRLIRASDEEGGQLSPTRFFVDEEGASATEKEDERAQRGGIVSHAVFADEQIAPIKEALEQMNYTKEIESMDEIYANDFGHQQSDSFDLPEEVEPEEDKPYQNSGIGNDDLIADNEDQETPESFPTLNQENESIETSNKGGEKFACRLCQRPASKGRFAKHVRVHHLGKQIQCLFCPYIAKLKKQMQIHQLHMHGKTMRPTTFRSDATKKDVKELANQCFGLPVERARQNNAASWTDSDDEVTEPQNVDATGKAQCRLCRAVVVQKHFHEHAETTHMGRPHRCRLCPWNSSHRSSLRMHLYRVHERKMDSQTARCLVTKEQVKEVALRCFGPRQAKDLSFGPVTN